ncbi:MAG: DoxX family protein [Thermoanaerobaculia bacterium]|jgi:putative oxidoreductase|nr:DoxX family protein [Thermoanaerobaculia bacterium]MBP9822966.1 DoxX family protein [Thermoanaerobaculia bacterium]
MNSKLEKYGSLVARFAVAAIFVYGGWGKLNGLDGTAAYIASKGLPAAELGALFAALLELVGGLAIALGIGTRWAALALAIFLVPATWLFHNPIGLDAAAAQMQMIHVYKNLAIAGGLLAFTAFGAGPLALEARTRRPWQPGQLGFRSISRSGVQS